MLGFKYPKMFEVAQSAGVVEYTDCLSAEELPPLPHNECPGFDSKQSDSEATVMPQLWECRALLYCYRFLAHFGLEC